MMLPSWLQTLFSAEIILVMDDNVKAEASNLQQGSNYHVIIIELCDMNIIAEVIRLLIL